MNKPTIVEAYVALDELELACARDPKPELRLHLLLDRVPAFDEFEYTELAPPAVWPATPERRWSDNPARTIFAGELSVEPDDYTLLMFKTIRDRDLAPESPLRIRVADGRRIAFDGAWDITRAELDVVDVEPVVLVNVRQYDKPGQWIIDSWALERPEAEALLARNCPQYTIAGVDGSIMRDPL